MGTITLEALGIREIVKFNQVGEGQNKEIFFIFIF
jgi:hypothetical protein